GGTNRGRELGGAAGCAAREKGAISGTIAHDSTATVNTCWDLGGPANIVAWSFQLVGEEIRIIDCDTNLTAGVVLSGGDMDAVTIGGDVRGGSGPSSGLVTSGGDFRFVKIGRHVSGSSIHASAKFQSVTIGGSVSGSAIRGTFDKSETLRILSISW